MTSSRPIKAATLFLSSAYLATNCLFAYAPEGSLWEGRRAARSASLARGSGLPAASPIDLSRRLSVSPAFAARHRALLAALAGPEGTLRKIAGPADGPLVVHIQDVHQNLDAQKNIGAAVARLLDAGAALVALEGASAPLDVERFRRAPHRETVRKVADYLLRKNLISGPVRTAMLRETGAAFLGVETEDFYQANVEAYRRAAALVPAARRSAENRRRAVAGEKARAFNASLRALDRAVEAYHAGGALLSYAEALIAAAPAPLPDPVAKFDRAMALEKSIRFDRVAREREALAARLAPALTKQETETLAADGLAYRAGALPYGEFYGRLAALCAKKGVPLSAFPEMDKYVRYVLICDRIDPGALFDALTALERAALDGLARTGAERDLLRRGRRAALAAKLIDFALTPAEWAEYSAAGEADLAAFEDFYRAAERRDRAMADNLAAAWKKTEGPAVLVTGGFHAPGLERELAARGFAVASFVPRIDQLEQGGEYLSAFTREKTPLDKLFEGEKLFLAQRPLAPNAPAEGAVAGIADRVRAGRPAEEAARDFGARIDGAAADGGAVRIDWGGASARVAFDAAGEIEDVSPLPRRDRLDLPAAGARFLGRARVFLDISDGEGPAVRQGREAFGAYVDALKDGRADFNPGRPVPRESPDPAFGLWFDRWIARLQEHHLGQGGLPREEALRIADEILNEHDLPGPSPALRAVVESFKKSVSLSPGLLPHELEAFVRLFEADLRNKLAGEVLSSPEVARAVWEADQWLGVKGYGLELNPKGLRDEHLVIALRLQGETVRETDEGPVTVQAVAVVTRFKDGHPRLAGGWSPFFSPVVRVRPDHSVDEDRAMGVRLRPEQGQERGLPYRLGRAAQALTLRAFRGLSSAERFRQRQEATIAHEVEHERRRRKIGLMEGDDIHVGLEEELAELRAMQQAEPFHILAGLAAIAGAREATGEPTAAWAVLARLLGVPAENSEAMAAALDALAENGDAAWLRERVDAAYAAAEKEWEAVHARKIKRRAGLPGAGILAKLFKKPSPRSVAGLETGAMALLYPLIFLAWSDFRLPEGLDAFSRAAGLSLFSSYLLLLGYHALGIQVSDKKWVPGAQVTVGQVFRASNTAALSLLFVPFLLMAVFFQLPWFAAVGLIALGLYAGHFWHGARNEKIFKDAARAPPSAAAPRPVKRGPLSTAALLTTHERAVQGGKSVLHRARYRDFPEGGRRFTLEVGALRFRITSPAHGELPFYRIEQLNGRQSGLVHQVFVYSPVRLAPPELPGHLEFDIPHRFSDDIRVTNHGDKAVRIRETYPPLALPDAGRAGGERLASRPEELIIRDRQGRYRAATRDPIVPARPDAAYTDFGDNFWQAYAHAFSLVERGRPIELPRGADVRLDDRAPHLLEFSRPGSAETVRLLLIPQGKVVALVQPDTGDYAVLSRSDAKHWTLADPGEADGHSGNFFIGWGTAYQTGVGPEIFRAWNNSRVKVRIHRLPSAAAEQIGKRAAAEVHEDEDGMFILARFNRPGAPPDFRIPLRRARHSLDVAEDIALLSERNDLDAGLRKFLAAVARHFPSAKGPAVYTFNIPFADLHGVAALKPEPLLAIHQGLMADDGARAMALLHEAMHLLILRGRLSLQLTGRTLQLSLSIGEGRGERYLLPLSEETLAPLAGRSELDHYLIRAFTREVFPDHDAALTRAIRARPPFVPVGFHHPFEKINPFARRMDLELGPVLAEAGLAAADEPMWEPVPNRLNDSWDWLARRGAGRAVRGHKPKNVIFFQSLLRHLYHLNTYNDRGATQVPDFDRNFLREAIEGVPEGALLVVLEETPKKMGWSGPAGRPRTWMRSAGYPEGLGEHLLRRPDFRNVAELDTDLGKPWAALAEGHRLFIFRRVSPPSLIGKKAVVREVFEHQGRLFLDARLAANPAHKTVISLLPASRALAFGWDLWFLVNKWGAREPAWGLLHEAVAHFNGRVKEVYTFRENFADLLGLSTLLPRPLVALHATVLDYDAPRRVALLHEVLHLMVAGRRLQIELAGRELRVTYLNQREELMRFHLPLGEAAYGLAAAHPADPHYLIRALQRELLAADDDLLSALILRRTTLRYPENSEDLENLDPHADDPVGAARRTLKALGYIDAQAAAWELRLAGRPARPMWVGAESGGREPIFVMYSPLRERFLGRVAGALVTSGEKAVWRKALSQIPRGALVLVVEQHREFIDWNGRPDEARAWIAELGFPHGLGEHLYGTGNYTSLLRGGRPWYDLKEGYRVFLFQGEPRRTRSYLSWALAAVAAGAMVFGAPPDAVMAAGGLAIARAAGDPDEKLRRAVARRLGLGLARVRALDAEREDFPGRRRLLVTDARDPENPLIEVHYRFTGRAGQSRILVSWQRAAPERAGLGTLALAYLVRRHGTSRLAFDGLTVPGLMFVSGLVEKRLLRLENDIADEEVKARMSGRRAEAILGDGEAGRPLSILDPFFRRAVWRAEAEGRPALAGRVDGIRRAWNAGVGPFAETLLFFAWPAGGALTALSGVFLFAAAHDAADRLAYGPGAGRGPPASFLSRLVWGAVFAAPFLPLFFGFDVFYEAVFSSAALHAFRNLRAERLTDEALARRLGLHLDSRAGRIAYRPGRRPPVLPVGAVFARHGRTSLNARGAFQGDADMAQNQLTEEGRADALEMAESLWARFGGRLEAGEKLAVVMSPLGRAKESAQSFIDLVRARVPGANLYIREEPLAREVSFGDWEGLTESEVRGLESQNAVARYRAGDVRAAGNGGESFLRLMARSRLLVERLHRHKEAAGGAPLVLFAHGTLLTALAVDQEDAVIVRRPAPLRERPWISWRPASELPHRSPFFIEAPSPAVVPGIPAAFGQALAQAAGGDPRGFSRGEAWENLRELIPVEGPLLEDIDGGFVMGFRETWGGRPAAAEDIQLSLGALLTETFKPGAWPLAWRLRTWGADPAGLHVVVLPPAAEVGFDLRAFVHAALKASGRRETLFVVPDGREAHSRSNEAMEFAAQAKAGAPYSRGVIPAAAIEKVGDRWVLRMGKLGKLAESKPALVSVPDLYAVDTSGAAENWRSTVILVITAALRAAPIRFLDMDRLHRAARAIAASA